MNNERALHGGGASLHDPGAPQFDAAALTAALSLDAKPGLSGAARKITATYAIPYDSLMARRRRAILAESLAVRPGEQSPLKEELPA